MLIRPPLTAAHTTACGAAIPCAPSEMRPLIYAALPFPRRLTGAEAEEDDGEGEDGRSLLPNKQFLGRTLNGNVRTNDRKIDETGIAAGRANVGLSAAVAIRPALRRAGVASTMPAVRSAIVNAALSQRRSHCTARPHRLIKHFESALCALGSSAVVTAHVFQISSRPEKLPTRPLIVSDRLLNLPGYP